MPTDPLELKKYKTNTFRQFHKAEPEYKVIRQDSIGQAAKENTQNIIEQASKELKASAFKD